MSIADRDLPSAHPVRCAILTISDSRTEASDTSGRAIAGLLTAAGHEVVDRRIVPDEPALVAPVVLAWAAGSDLRVIITTGGSGISRRDSTYEAIHGLIEKELPGFGELFRMLSFREIGSAAMLSRAMAGTIARTAVFVLPGSEHAVRLAMTSLILPELPHIDRELTKLA